MPKMGLVLQGGGALGAYECWLTRELQVAWAMMARGERYNYPASLRV